MAKKLPFGLLAAAVLTSVAVAASVFWLQTRPDPDAATANSAAVVPAVKIGGPFSLVNAEGTLVDSTSLPGKLQLVYFGYSYCPDVCTQDLQISAAAVDNLPEELAAEVTPVFITIDPERDQGDVLRDYAGYFHPQMVGLGGSLDQVAAVAQSFRVFYRKAPQTDAADDYLMDHSAFFYLMHRDGRFIAIFRHGTDPAEIAAVMQRSLAG